MFPFVIILFELFIRSSVVVIVKLVFDSVLPEFVMFFAVIVRSSFEEIIPA